MLKRPLITEKSMMLSKASLYTFEVPKGLNKHQIAEFVKDKFKVDVLSVKTVKISGKRKNYRVKRGFYYKNDIKKALVQVKEGQKIALFESATAEQGDKEEVEVRTAENGEKVATVKEKKSLFKGTKVKIERGQPQEKKMKEEESK